MYILGIETSCDETAASVVKRCGRSGKVSVLANIISSQIDIHQQYGGVVPEVAAREHVINILPVIDQALQEANIKPAKLDYLAVTKGPGLITSLISGLETVRVLSYVWRKPVIEVNHIEGHIFSNFINPNFKIEYPAIILTVSGGHTNLVRLAKGNKLKVVGETLDDAAGEAYDKGAKMLGLTYPGGPIISKLAKEYQESFKSGQVQDSDIKLPRPMIGSKDLNFSFSGLKTALLYRLQQDKKWKKRIPEYCYYYQEAIIDILVTKTIKAAKQYKAKTVMLAGGVSANEELRIRLAQAVAKLGGVSYLVPERAYTTDNAAMIAAAATFKTAPKFIRNFKQLRVEANLPLK
ncbi:MAG: tRNA (adenosine(37)-N6)-threonylcarbamoyltransferase complex transferase subunit TsaD [Patescibacteria group bacterium]|jgi:N6-L-threonylcarbamoyladenine synthase